MYNRYELFFDDNKAICAEIKHSTNLSSATIFSIKVDGFIGSGIFWLTDEDIRDYINKLIEMDKNLTGECSIFDTESENQMHIYFKDKRLFVEGRVGNYESISLQYKMEVDQTILKRLLKLFKDIAQ